jgi:hypothetical protein
MVTVVHWVSVAARNDERPQAFAPGPFTLLPAHCLNQFFATHVIDQFI